MSRYGSTEHHNLTTVVRQAAQSGILYNATVLRNNIENNIIAFPKIKTAGFNDIERIAGSELPDKLAEAYEKYGERETMVICRSNKRANIYNNGIRSRLLFREEELLRGDRLMIVKNCYQFLENTDKLDFIANGDIAELVNIRRHEERYGLRFARAELRFPDYDDVEITAKIMLDTLHLETPSLDAERQTKLYEGVLADNVHLKTKFARNRAVREDPYYNALQIRYANAITCHKAQGGQWKAIFLDYPFRHDMTPTFEDLRWLYTAFTRATEHLYLVNFPQDKNESIYN
jgi:exodeoxyribonuclease-5